MTDTNDGRAPDGSGSCPSGHAADGVDGAARFDPSRCRNCAGTGWVCENHPDHPWSGLTDKVVSCGCGAGAPCGVCNLGMASAPYSEPLLALARSAISYLQSAEKETSWGGDPMFGPSPSQEMQEELDRILQSWRDSDGSPQGEDAEAASFTTARAEGIAQPEVEP